VNVDVTCYYGGYHGDCSETFLVGEVDEAGKRLVKVTHDCWRAAIDYCRPGRPYSGIGKIIEEYIAPYGYTSVREFCGHGIGKVFHTNPNILHYKNNEPGKMEVGHVFTIEPMICEGVFQHVMWNDQWTATTRDGKRSAQFEHTLLVTENGVEAFTGRLPTSNAFFWEGGAPMLDAARGLSLVVPDALADAKAVVEPTATRQAAAAPTKGFSDAASPGTASASKKQQKARAAALKKKKKKGK